MRVRYLINADKVENPYVMKKEEFITFGKMEIIHEVKRYDTKSKREVGFLICKLYLKQTENTPKNDKPKISKHKLERMTKKELIDFILKG